MGAPSSHALALLGPAGDSASPVHRLDPRAKLLGLVTIAVVAVSSPLSAWPVFVACAALLLGIAATARVPAVELWRRCRLVLALVVLVALVVPLVRSGGDVLELGPVSVHEAGLSALATVAVKATLGILAAALLSATTPFPALVRGLEALRVPRLLTMIAAFMHRYLFVIVDEVVRMRAAVVARGYRPRHAFHARAMGRLAAALFVRSYERGERVYLAMLARGYQGTMPQLSPLRLRHADVAFVLIVAVAIVPLRAAVAVG